MRCLRLGMAERKTTVQVSHETLRLLVLLKQKHRKNSYDAVIREIARDHLDISASMAGWYPNLKWSKK